MRSRFRLLTAVAFALAACADQPPTSTIDGPLFAMAAPDPADAAELVAYMDGVNAGLEATDAEYRIGFAEFLSGGGAGDEVAATLLQKDVGNKRLSQDFVPFDPRRAWSGPSAAGRDDITFAID